MDYSFIIEYYFNDFLLNLLFILPYVFVGYGIGYSYNNTSIFKKLIYTFGFIFVYSFFAQIGYIKFPQDLIYMIIGVSLYYKNQTLYYISNILKYIPLKVNILKFQYEKQKVDNSNSNENFKRREQEDEYIREQERQRRRQEKQREQERREEQETKKQNENDPYIIFNLPRDATVEEIKERCKILRALYHTDKYQSKKDFNFQHSSEMMKKINNAYDELKKMRGFK